MPRSGPQRVLVLAPTPADERLCRRVLHDEGLSCRLTSSLGEMAAELDRAGAGALLVTDDILASPMLPELAAGLAEQPDWSDVPVVMLAKPRGGSSLRQNAGRLLGNVTFLDRPVRIPTLASALRSAIRARQRQYELRTRLQELREREAALREADRHKDEFLATLAHELRNPLAPIRNSLAVLELGGGGPEVRERERERIARQVDQLVRLVDDLLDVSRIERGKLELHREITDLQSVLSLSVETARPAIDSRGHELVVELPGEPIPVEADRVRLAQVFANLLDNAAKYTDPGGTIRLRVSRSAAGEAEVEVSDTGIGIAAEAIPNLFEMFTQVDPGPGRTRSGLGLGLTLVRQILELHGGRIEVRSEGPSRGALFLATLPVAQQEPAARAKENLELRGDPNERRRILVVDDNVDAAESLGELLKLAGHDIHTAHDGIQAVEMADALRPDLVLMDIGMPRIDGYEAARRIRRHDWGRELTLVAVTGWGHEADKQRAEAAGFDLHFTKPVQPAAVFGLLEELGSEAED